MNLCYKHTKSRIEYRNKTQSQFHVILLKSLVAHPHN